MSSDNQTGIGLFGVIGIVFIILKLCHVIKWSWWLVLLPFYFWIPIVMILLLVLTVLYILSLCVGG